MTDKKSYHRGVLFSFSSALLWGTTFVCAKYLLSSGAIDPFSLAFSRYFLGGTLLLIICLLLCSDKLFKISFKDFLRLALLGGVGMAGSGLLLFLGQMTSSATDSAIILQSNPVLIMLLGLFIGERVNRFEIGGMIACLVGCMMVVEIITSAGFNFATGHLTGDLLVALAALCWAVYSVLSRRTIEKIGALVSSAWLMLFGALELLFVMLILKTATNYQFYFSGSFDSWCWIIYLGLLPTGIAYWAWDEASSLIELSLLNVMQYLTPIFTIILSIAILGEKLTVMNVLGIILVIGGVLLTGLKPAKEGKNDH